MSTKLEVSIPVNIGISDEHRKSVVDILNTLLCDEYLLYTQTRNYHWNVVGMQFNDLHKFFENQYESLNEIVDDVAERTRTLGGRALGTLSEFTKHARLKEETGEYSDAKKMLSNLLNNHEAVVRYLRTDLEKCADQFHDAGTVDFLTGLMEKHEKMAWMLRAFLEGR